MAKMLPAYVIIVNAMKHGVEIQMPSGHTMTMGLDKDGNDTLSYVMTKITPDKKEEKVLFSADITFNYFMRQCEQFTNEQLVVIAANHTLNQLLADKYIKKHV